ncbi:MAG: DUF4198 domain-containing protein [Synergistaceae bacterium]|nr:DUF4198 domain-containing protein [Synergistaceae bacterium]
MHLRKSARFSYLYLVIVCFSLVLASIGTAEAHLLTILPENLEPTLDAPYTLDLSYSEVLPKAQYGASLVGPGDLGFSATFFYSDNTNSDFPAFDNYYATDDHSPGKETHRSTTAGGVTVAGTTILWARSEMNMMGVMPYYAYSKAILNPTNDAYSTTQVGSATFDFPNAGTQAVLEIVPTTDLALAEAGNPITFEVYFNGAPLVGAEVEWADALSPVTIGVEGETNLASLATTDASGQFEFTPQHPGINALAIMYDEAGKYYANTLIFNVPVAHVTTGAELDAAIRAAGTGHTTTIVLDNDIDATTSATYGAVERGPGKWVTIDGGGNTINGDTDPDTSSTPVKYTGLRFGSNYQSSVNGNKVVLKNLTFNKLNNGVRYGGGAIAMNGGALEVDNCTFNENRASGATSRGGAALLVQHGTTGTVSVKDSDFTGNVATGPGGAIFVAGPTTIEGCDFDGNIATQGGAIALTGSGGTLAVDATSTFTNNVATYSGGAIHIYGVSGNNYFAAPITATIEAGATFTTNIDGVDDLVNADTNNYVLSVNYPATFTANIDSAKLSSLTVGGTPVQPTYFADANRSTPINAPIEVSSYEQLRDALGYYAYDNSGVRDTAITQGTAEAGDVVVITGPISYHTHDNNKSSHPTLDAETGATLFVDRDLTILGNGKTIYGNGYPVFDIDGGEHPVSVGIGNLTVSGGGYSAKLGGAVFVEGNASLSVYNSTFVNNVAGAGSAGSNIAGGGGAIYLDPHGGDTPKLTVANSNFIGNRAPYGSGGAISALNGEVTINSGTFDGNSAAEGGAIGVKGTGTLTFSGNTAKTFSNNEATYSGGAIVIHYGRSWYKKEAALNQDSRITTLLNGAAITFTDNSAEFGDDIAYSRYYDSDFPDDASSLSDFVNGTDANLLFVEDLRFSDINRTTLYTVPAPPSGGGGGSGGGSGGSGGGGSVTPPADDGGEPVVPPVTPVTPGTTPVGDVTFDLNNPSSLVGVVITPSEIDLGSGLEADIVTAVNPTSAQIALLGRLGLSVSLDPTTGGIAVAVTGTPTAVGILDVPIVVTDSSGVSHDATYRVEVLPKNTTGATISISNPREVVTLLEGSPENPTVTVTLPTDVPAEEAAEANEYAASYSSFNINVGFSGGFNFSSARFETSSSVNQRGAGSANLIVKGTATDKSLSNVAFTSVTYVSGTERITRPLSLKLSETSLNDETSAGGGGIGDSGGSSGCDSGSGVFALVALGAVALRKKNQGSAD